MLYARAGPGYSGPGTYNDDLSKPSPSFITIRTETGEYKEGGTDRDPARGKNPDPNAIPHFCETIKEGDDLSEPSQNSVVPSRFPHNFFPSSIIMA
jgi:hypothetical protein